MKRMFLALALLLLAGQAHAAALDDCHDQIPYGAPTVLVPTDVVCHTAYLSFVDPLAKMPRLVAELHAQFAESAMAAVPPWPLAHSCRSAAMRLSWVLIFIAAWCPVRWTH